jgi:hypothetical protein
MLMLAGHSAHVRHHGMRPINMPISFVSILVPCSHEPSWCNEERFTAGTSSLHRQCPFRALALSSVPMHISSLILSNRHTAEMTLHAVCTGSGMDSLSQSGHSSCPEDCTACSSAVLRFPRFVGKGHGPRRLSWWRPVLTSCVS